MRGSRHSNRPNGVTKITNEYADSLAEFYERTPKAVFAALAVSYAMMLHGEDCDVEAMLREEWQALFANHIIPQCPPRTKAVPNV